MRITSVLATLSISSLLCLLEPANLKAWTWGVEDSTTKTTYAEFSREIQEYMLNVSQGLPLSDRVRTLKKIISTYRPRGIDTSELEEEYKRLDIEWAQSRLGKAHASQIAEEARRKAKALYQNGKYAQAASVFEGLSQTQALHTEDNRLSNHLSSIASILPLEKGTGKIPSLIRKAINHYLSNDPVKALNALRYASDLSPSRSDISKLISMVTGEFPGLSVSPTLPGMNLVETKLQSALEHIYQGQFWDAAKECHEALDLDPTNVLALARLGSAYYALGDYGKARTYWQNAIMLDRFHPALKGFVMSPIPQHNKGSRISKSYLKIP